jgi:hypothetical protein
MRVKHNPELQIIPFENKNDKRPKNLNPNLPWNFSMLIIGQPKSGKTVFWLNMITRKKKYYYRQFDKIIIFSASFRTISQELKLPDDQMIDGFDEDILQEFLSDQKHSADLTLFIFDDVITKLKKGIEPLLDMIRNRRHCGKGSSIMIVTQKFNACPIELRATMSHFVMYNKHPKELEDLRIESTTLDRQEFKELTDYVFDKNHNFLYIDRDQPKKDMFYKNFDKVIFDDEEEEEEITKTRTRKRKKQNIE